jgi:NadR type nicotinamide-nucleotide adenylyltransferase
MEKTIQSSNQLKKIAIIGPECTGKTTLAQQLANHFNTIWIPEFARDYIESLEGSYSYNDVETIAKKQWEQINSKYPNATQLILFDTDLIITKIWFKIVYHKIPNWIDNAIKESKFEKYLLCNTDIQWVADKVRENGGEKREQLFKIYKNELEYYKFHYEIISGVDKNRFEQAVTLIQGYF